jgi:S1-C subfamily serine protease
MKAGEQTLFTVLATAKSILIKVIVAHDTLPTVKLSDYWLLATDDCLPHSKRRLLLMNRHMIKWVGWLAAVVLALVLGVAVGGGAVLALAQNQQEDSGAADQANPEPGILVASVIPDSPAARAGVKRGDIILRVDAQTVNLTRELASYMQSQPSGSQVMLTVLHGDEERVLPATLEDRDGRPFLGIVPCGRGAHSVITDPVSAGAMITSVVPDSPAAQADLQRGDIIVAVDGQEVDQANSLTDLIRTHVPGDMVTLTIQRPAETAREVTVTLAANPAEAGQAYLGIGFRQVPGAGAFQGRQFLPGRDRPVVPAEQYEPAIIIRNVEEGSPAESAGLSRGDVITAINGEPVERAGDLVDAAAERQPGETVTLTVTQAGEDESREVTVTLGENPDSAGVAYIGIAIDGFIKMHRSAAEDDKPN